MNKQKLLLIIILVIVATISIYNFLWVVTQDDNCIATNCSLWYTGDEWISHNCRPKGENGEQGLYCNFIIDKMQYSDIPLSNINASLFKSCGELTCTKKIYVRNTMEVLR